jgi:Tfp pilus assembly protein PilF/4-amino-4-deoxy-L-arabinose transferase-like glycosyltransferase
MGRKRKKIPVELSKKKNTTCNVFEKRTWILITFVFLFSLSLRMLYLSQCISTPLFHGLVVDAEKYDALALKILVGEFTHKEFIYLNPLYPFFLALLYFVFTHSYLAVMITQAVVDSLSCILIYYIASTCFNKVVGIISAITYACYGLAIFYTGTIITPTLDIFLSLSCIASLQATQRTRTPLLFSVAGIFLGLAVSSRPNVILFLLFLPLWFFSVVNHKVGISKSILRFLLFLGGFSAVMLPIAIRNFSIEKRFSPLAVQGGINFYIGNNSQATGTFMSPYGISSSPIDQVKTSIRFAEKASGKSLSPSEASRYWLYKGVAFIKDNPLLALALYVKKCALFWRKEELPLNIDYALSKAFIPLFILPFISFGMVAPFALLGIILSFKKWNDILPVILFIVSYMLSVTIFFVTARYRIPIVPFLIIFASYALYYVVERVRAKDTRGIIISGALLILLFTGINKDLNRFTLTPPAKHYSNLGMVYHRQGKLDEAVSALKKSLSIDPYGVEAHYNLGNVYFARGLFNQAINEYKEALKINPDFAEAYNNLGMVYGKQELLDEAISQFTNVLTADPDFADAYYNRGTAYGKKGLLDEAIADLKKSLSINPEDSKALFNLGLAYHRKGMREEAIPQFKRAIAINPHLKEVCPQLGVNIEVRDTP